MAEPRGRHPGDCNDWCAEWGCGNAARGYTFATNETFADVLRTEYVEPIRQAEGAFARAFRQEMEGLRQQELRDVQRTALYYGTAGDPEYVGQEMRIPVRRNRNTAVMREPDTLPPPQTNYAEYRWLPDQDLYITPEGERITGLQMQARVEGGYA